MIRCSIVFLLAMTSAYSQSSSYRQNPKASTDPSVSAPGPAAKTLVKVGAALPILRQSSFTGYYAALALEATVEQKLYRGLTVLGGIDNTFGRALDGRGTKFYSLDMPLAVRYYFSLTRRQKQRADRHSFFSPYVAIQTHNVIRSRVDYEGRVMTDLANYHRGTVSYNNLPVWGLPTSGRVGERWNMLEYAYLQVGSQHSVFRQRAYLDVNVAVPVPGLIYNKYEYTLSTPPIVNVKLGYKLVGR